jgi:hypothetical protein
MLPCARKMFEKIILTRFEYWADKYEILSPTQCGFRKSREDCVALLLTAIQTSFEYKQQTLVGFLDISRAYDNVLIDILCDQMHQTQLPARILRVMWNLPWCFIMIISQWRNVWYSKASRRVWLSVHFRI